ncbi:MAG: Cys-tRNA(Pro) deacylase [Clostridia bacterium]|nr:Cys-tRNA(Pro) deacylase [Clostridia bacterium]
MRVLDQKKVKYTPHSIGDNSTMTGTQVAQVLQKPADEVFKTLVTVGKSGNKYVFVVPIGKELDLKKAAKAVNEKSIEMLKSKELLPLTGYIHGGCSPIGMKKLFTTTVDISAKDKTTICFSAGKIGYQVELDPNDLSKVIKFTYSDIAI